MIHTDVALKIKDPNKHEELAFQIDTEYEMIHFISTMKKPYIAVMDGITSRYPISYTKWFSEFIALF